MINMNKTILLLTLFVISSLATGCATTQGPKDYSKFEAANIRSILLVPVVNNSVDVTAADYFLSTVPIPVAEHGYYIFPVNMVKRVLEDDGLSDASLVHSASTEKLCSIFGADAALYITIERWEAQYLVLSTQVTVELDYVLKSGDSGEELWRDHQIMTYSPSSSGSGGGLATLVVMAVNAAITKANPDYIPLARQANAKAFKYPGPGFPHGPYSPVKDNAGGQPAEKAKSDSSL